MKYLLVGINAKYIHSNLGIHCLRAYAKQYSGICPEIREYTINMPMDEIRQSIYAQKPDLIAFSVYIWNVEMTFNLVRDIKKLLPKVRIFLGGPEVSFESERLLEQINEIDGIMLGEGEQTFCELINHFESVGKEKLEDLSQIKGLIYKGINNTIRKNDARDVIDLSTVPFPYKDLSDFENRILYYETSRGCPFGCAYCLSSVDKTLRFRSMDLVKEEFLFFIENKVPQVKLVDRTFNVDHKRSVEMLSFIKEHDNGVTNFHFEIAGDILTDEEISIINSLRPGLVQLEIGVQSTNCNTLDAINRHTDLERLKRNVGLLLEGGRVHLHLDLIAGLPYENLESFKKSFNEVYLMGSNELQLGFLKVLKGAPINEMKYEQEIRYSSVAPYEVLSTKYISYEEICELKHLEEMLEIYHNSCQFMLSEKFLLELSQSPYDMYLDLYRFYMEKEQPIIQCKRFVRYELFLEYAIQRFALSDEKKERLKNLLTLDFYSREKAKARPSFATNVDKYKTEIRKLSDEFGLNRGENIHVEPVYGTKEFAVFNYKNKSMVTGNVLINYVLGEE